MSVRICFSLDVNLETYGKLHPYVFFQIGLWEGQHKIYSFWIEIVYFGNFKDEGDSEHIGRWRICFSVSATPLLHATVRTYTSFMHQQLSIQFSFSFDRPDELFWSCFIWNSIAVYNWPVTTVFMVSDLLLRIVNKCYLIILFHWISKREDFVGIYVGRVKQVMWLIEGSIIDLVYFMKPVHKFICEGMFWIGFLNWHFNIRG